MVHCNFNFKYLNKEMISNNVMQQLTLNRLQNYLKHNDLFINLFYPKLETREHLYVTYNNTGLQYENLVTR